MPAPSVDSFVYILHSQMQEEDLVLDLSTSEANSVTVKQAEAERPDYQQWRVYRSGHIQNVKLQQSNPKSGYLTRGAAGQVVLAEVIVDPDDFIQVWHYEQGPDRVKPAPPWRIKSTVIGEPEDGIVPLVNVLTAPGENEALVVSQKELGPPLGQRWYAIERPGHATGA